MASSIRHITFDCHDVELVGRFWAAVLGYEDDPENQPGDPEWFLASQTAGVPGLLFVGVPEDKVVKNRVHLDLKPADTMEAEVDRLVQPRLCWLSRPSASISTSSHWSSDPSIIMVQAA